MNVNAVKTGLYDKLAGDATLVGLLASTTSVYDKVAPQGAALPYVIFQKQAGSPRYTMGGRAYDDNVYLVKAVTESPSAKVAGQIAERVDALLTNGSLTLTTGSLMVMRREQDVEYEETTDGRTYQHVGAMYLIGVQ